MLKVEEVEFKEKGVSHNLSLLELENAVIAFFYDGERKMGTLAFALPGTEGGGIASSVLLGGKYLMASRALAERFAASFRKMSLVSVYTALPEAEAFRIFVKLLNDLLTRRMKAA